MNRQEKIIPISKPFFDEKEEKAIAAVIRSGWVMQGPKVAEFEKVFADYVGSKYAVAVSSGTAALHLGLMALGVKLGDRVVIPSLSFIATANAVVHCGADPIFIDIDDKTYNIDPQKIEEYLIGIKDKGEFKKIKAIMPVHQLGMPADMDRIMAIGKKYGIQVIEDAACAIGSEYKGRKVGNIGDIACFSFHPRKIITTGEGGMITTNNEKIAKKVRLLRNHGMAYSPYKGKKGRLSTNEYPIVGYNYRMTDLQGAMGLAQMEKLDFILSKRRSLARKYDELLTDVKFVERPHIPGYAFPNYQSYMVRLKGDAKKERDYVVSKMLESGIACKEGVQAIHLEKCYKDKYKGDELINTRKVTDSSLLLPLFPGLSEQDQKKIIRYLKKSTDGLVWKNIPAN